MAWVPLEANPELFAHWCATLGLDTSKYTFHDVLGTDDELLAMVPQPAHAVLFLFPITPAVEARRNAEDASAPAPSDTQDVLWFKQTVRHAPRSVHADRRSGMHVAQSACCTRWRIRPPHRRCAPARHSPSCLTRRAACRPSSAQRC